MKKILLITILTIPFFLTSCRQKGSSDLIGKVFSFNPELTNLDELYIEFDYTDDRYGKWGANYIYTVYTTPMSLNCFGVGTFRVEGKYVWLSNNSSSCYWSDELGNRKYPISKFKWGSKSSL
jgi:hypothetical protein